MVHAALLLLMLDPLLSGRIGTQWTFGAFFEQNDHKVAMAG
jgi:hypothetical protein